MFSVRFSVFWPAVNSAAPRTPIPVPTSVQGRGTANGRVIGLQPPAPFLPPKSPPLLSTVWEMAGAGIPGERGRLSLQQRSSGGSRARPSVPAGEDGARLRPAVPSSRTGGPCAAVTGGCVTGDSQQVDAWWLSRVKAPLPCGATAFERQQPRPSLCLHSLQWELSRAHLQRWGTHGLLGSSARASAPSVNNFPPTLKSHRHVRG